MQKSQLKDLSLKPSVIDAVHPNKNPTNISKHNNDCQREEHLEMLRNKLAKLRFTSDRLTSQSVSQLADNSQEEEIAKSSSEPSGNKSSSLQTTTTEQSLTRNICHGIVKEDDFEKLVPSHWWKTVFADSLYLKTDGDVVEDPEITRAEIRMLESNSIIRNVFYSSSGCSVLDLCCGQGRHSLMLAEKFPLLRICGHDQSSYLISLARERAATLLADGVSVPTFTVGDCRTVPHEKNSFDLVMVMGNSFGYFSANDIHESTATAESVEDHGDKAVLMEINRVLKHGGHVVLDLTDGDYMRKSYTPRSWEWLDNHTFACRERVLSKDKKRLYSREVITSVTKGVIRDQFYSERLYSRDELSQMMAEFGLEVDSGSDSSNELDTVTTAREMSQRGQDLGMMEQRILLIARKTRDFTKSKSKELLGANGPVISSVQSTKKMEYDFNSAEFLQSVRNWIVELKATLSSSPTIQNHLGALESKYLFGPSVYHLLPLPPFPNNCLAIIMGDTNLPCREKLNGVWNNEDFETRQKLYDALVECGFARDQLKIFENHKKILNELASIEHSLFALNLCDEGFMNNALKELHVTAMLEMLNIPYSGAGPLSLGICYDKGLTNSTAAKIGVPTPRETFVMFADSVACKDIKLEDVQRIVFEKEKSREILYPAFVKPMKGDNSLGITGKSICHTREELSNYLFQLIQTYSIKEFLVQEYLCGTEYSVGMIGNPKTGYHFFPILQVDYSKVLQEGLQPILGWESKWDPSSPYWNDIGYVVAPRIPSAQHKISAEKQSSFQTGGLSAAEEEALKQHCITLFEKFGCQDYARFDWRADKEISWDSSTGDIISRGRRKPDSAVDSSSANSPLTLESPQTQQLTVNILDVTYQQSHGLDNFTDSGTDSSSESHVRSQESIVTDSGHGSIISATDYNSAGQSQFYRTIKLLEINPNPGWCWDGKLAKMAAFDGKSYPELLKSILWASWERVYGEQLCQSS